MIDNEILKHEHRVDQRASALAESMVSELRASKEAILGRLAALAGEFGRELDDLPLSRRKAFYEAQAASIDGVLAEVYAKAGDHLREAGEDVMTVGALALAFSHPWIALIMVITLTVAFSLFVWWIWRKLARGARRLLEPSPSGDPASLDPPR